MTCISGFGGAEGAVRGVKCFGVEVIHMGVDTLELSVIIVVGWLK